jgi:hypothetical protein
VTVELDGDAGLRWRCKGELPPAVREALVQYKGVIITHLIGVQSGADKADIKTYAAPAPPPAPTPRRQPVVSEADRLEASRDVPGMWTPLVRLWGV